ncbi:DNA adenine methylase [Fusobacterium pseudoperiodonticum]|uniref:DNA adenine methylase n=1 Tax=Fusobacterium pseudoperiodonticum TaxID=2663009 RepID=UPI0021F2F125|nr:DNA adenine methylase [Fusobacterium pseudoperiodonticum]
MEGNKKGKVYNEDVNSLIKKVKGDILCLDSPYNTRQYSTNYHLLETISKYDNPVIK